MGDLQLQLKLSPTLLMDVSHWCVCCHPIAPTFCNPLDCGLLGSSVHRIFQARILEWVAIPSSRKIYRIIPWIQLFKEHLEPKTCWHMGKKCLGIKLKLLPWPYSNQWRIHIWKNLLDLPQEIMELKKVWRMINLRGKRGYLPHMERLKARSDCKGERWSKCDQSL